MTFSGPRALTEPDIERAIVDDVLPNRPLEVALPTSRAILARLATAAPAAVMGLTPLFVKLGKKKQEKMRGGKA